MKKSIKKSTTKSMKKFYLNALGINNAVGSNPEEVYRNVFIESKNFGVESSLISGNKTIVHLCAEKLNHFPDHLSRFESRNNRLLMQAADQVKPLVNTFIEKYGSQRIGIILGTSTSGIQETENYFKNKATGSGNLPFFYYKQEISNPGEFLAEYLKVDGINYTISTACTSSAKALIEARRLIEAGLCDAVIVGGVDSVSSLTLDGFDSLDSIAPNLTNPFSKNRNGINIGEGAALFILSTEPSEVEFLSYGESSDAYHLSAPDPTGTGAEIALKNALASARLSPSDIGYVNLHGTGTLKNDEMESALIQRIFGTQIKVSTTKPFFGHTLGAAGAQEAAVCYLSLSMLNSEGRLPVQLWDQDQDEKLPVLSFVKEEDRLKKYICMSNSFAFGGNNVSLIFSKVKL